MESECEWMEGQKVKKTAKQWEFNIGRIVRRMQEYSSGS